MSNTISKSDDVRVVLTATRWVSYVKQELLPLSEQLSSLTVSGGVCVARSADFCAMF